MNILSAFLSPARGRVQRALGAALIIGGMALAGSAQAQALRFSDLQWREVHDSTGQRLGAVSDLLPEMPSGKIVYVMVKPPELFARPKAIPADSMTIPSDRDAPLTTTISPEDWATAPRLDWSQRLLVRDTDQGPQIVATYQPRWPAPQPTGPTAQFVSLERLLLDQVEAPAVLDAGFIRDFLIDWSAQRTTHALVSPLFTAPPNPQEKWFAVPTTLLSTSNSEAGPLQVNAPPAAIANAQPRPSPGGADNDIFLLPATVGIGA